MILYRYIKPHLFWAILSPLMVGTEVCAELALPFFMSKIIDEGIFLHNPKVILPLGVKMLVISLIGMVGGLLSIFAAGIVAYGVGSGLRQTIFKKTTQLSFSELDKTQPSDLITCIFTNVNKIQNVIQSSMRLLYRAPILFIGSIFMVLSISEELSSILLIILPILLFSIIHITKKSYPFFKTIQEQTEKLNLVIHEVLSGIKVIRIFNQEEKEKKRFRKINDNLYDSNMEAIKRTVLLSPLMSLIINGGIAIVVYWAALLMETEGDIKVGEIMAITSYLTQILIALMMAQHIIISLTEANTSWVRIKAFILHDTDNKDSNHKVESFLKLENKRCKIRFENVSFAYGQNQGEYRDSFVLKNINFEVGEGETIGIIGGTGAGKSTLAQLLLKNYTPTHGNIYINDIPIDKIDKKDLHHHIGIAMQNVQLFAGTIAENLRFGKENATGKEMTDALETARISNFIKKTDMGLNHKLASMGMNLSGGQRQRISLARTLISKPDCLILDDCLNAIDQRTETLLFSALSKIDCTKIIISQRVCTIRHATRIIVLDKGEISGIGTHEELLHTLPIYQETVQSQSTDDNEKQE